MLEPCHSAGVPVPRRFLVEFLRKCLKRFDRAIPNLQVSRAPRFLVEGEVNKLVKVDASDVLC